MPDLSVPIDSLRPYPGNPRRGDVATIADSLRALGQYRPLVVDANTMHVLAGNHTWRAAKSLGWTRVDVTFVDVDAEGAARIVAVDNRSADLATYDDAVLVDLLGGLDDLEGTGFSERDLDRLRNSLEAGDLFGDIERPTRREKDTERIQVGTHSVLVAKDIYGAWAAELVEAVGPDPKVCAHECRRRLGMGSETFDAEPKVKPARKARKSKPSKTPAALVAQHPHLDSMQVPVGDLQLYPHNPRQGDVGAIATSLVANGQYRPVVVQRSTGYVLAGNHTVLAARSLGWETVAAVYVDADEADAARIVAVDNRATDLGVYDNQALVDLLTGLESLEGTGYDGDDLDGLLAGVTPYEADANREREEVNPMILVGSWRFQVLRGPFLDWQDAAYAEAGRGEPAFRRLVTARLGIPA